MTPRLLLVASLLPTLAVAQSAAPPYQTSPAVSADDLRLRVSIFAHDSMQGREAGTPGHVKATDYIARELARLGVQPAGDSGTYFQTVPVTVRRLDPAGVVSVDGQPLTPGDDYLVFPDIGLPGVGASFQAEGVPVVYGGKLSEPTLVGPDAVAGKLVLFAPADGPQGWQFWARFGPPQWQRFASAAGILIAAREALPDGLVSAFTQTSMVLEDGRAEAPTHRFMYVTREAAERMMGGPLSGLLPGAEGKVMTATAGFISGPPEAPARNVVGIVPGTDPALRQQYVGFGAHSDHDGIAARALEHDSLRAWNGIIRPGGAEDENRDATAAEQERYRQVLDSLRAVRPARADSVMNGADDDASGSMGLLEIAEARAASPARRSLLFVWHVAEEKGLYGARWYSDHPTVPRDSIVAMLNADMIGRGMEGDVPEGGMSYLQLIGSRRLSTRLGDMVEEVNAAKGFGFAFDYQYDANGHPQQYYCRSDHYEYAKWGIPIVFFSTGGHRDYHMVTDEPEYLNYEKLAKVSQFMGEVGATVADLDERVPVDKQKPDPRGQCRQ